MKFSYNWLTELVPDAREIGAEKLSNLITLKTAESEGVHLFGEHLTQVCAAKVLSVEPIEGSKNVKAAVDTVRYGTKQVVCGAPNCRPGMITAYVPSGTRLGDKEIQKAVIGGVESDGMLASGAELGINRDTAGVMELDLAPGAPIIAAGPDHIIEIDNKSLTHRPDLWGHHGMAREVAAITRKPLQDPVSPHLLPAGEPAVKVHVEDPELCPRYSALVFENVTVQASPPWLQFRLEAIGLNPINNIVDVTNYVMAELAQPMHAFDADKLQGGIIVRSAKDGEKVEALNGETYQLTPSNLVIADEREAVAIAGVIGGMGSAISGATRRIVFESANFHAGSVRKTSSALKLRTDASMRFEKAQDPVNTVRGLARAVELLQQVSPGIRLVGGLADVRKQTSPPASISLPLDWLNRKLGRFIEPAEVRAILESLAFGVTEGGPDTFAVSIPSWRATKDVSVKEDLVEEIGRMIGYGSITPVSPLLPATIPPPNGVRDYQHRTRLLVAAQGYHEVYNYSFLSDEMAVQFGLSPDDFVRVLNPIAVDQALMRTSLVPGLWKNIVENSKYTEEFRLFEIGREVHKQPSGLPNEVNHLAAVVYKKEGSAEGLFELKRLAESLAPQVVFWPTDPCVYEHPFRTANAVLDRETVGRLFEFHPNFVRGRAALLDLNLDALMRLGARSARYAPIRRFPSSSFDLSVLTKARAHVGTIQEELRQLAGDMLDGLEFVREYSGPPLPEGTKSVSYRLTLAAPDRTLSSDEVGRVRSSIIDGMKAHGYELRV